MAPPRSAASRMVAWLLLAATASAAADDASQQLYEAFNQLHTLSSSIPGTTIAVPGIAVVGRQTDGKSALIEALMGFQFNHVGGGTKTRKPIALQMQYAADADEPRCFLQTTAGERAVTLEELQRHIEAENRALEAAGEFDGAEIIVRIQYRHCPNLLLIDTPGLLAPPTKDADGAADADAADADAAATPTDPRERRVQELVLSKIRGDELFVLCVEEASDWLHAPARDLVARVDPSLSRSIVVATKLDTKFAQFTGADDLRHFLAAPTLHRRHPRLLGGPFFTSVPAGRVGATADHAYSTNRAFQNALAEQQRADANWVAHEVPEYVEAAATFSNTPDKGGGDAISRARIGVSELRAFLEEQLRQKYARDVHDVVPKLLKTVEELRAEGERCDAALVGFTPPMIRAACRRGAAEFAAAFDLALRGSPKGHPLGQTLRQEQSAGGGPIGMAALAAMVPSPDARAAAAACADAASTSVENCDASLYGGSQFYRLVAEWEAAVKALPAVSVTDEEAANAMGVGAQHEPIAVARVACAIALQRSAVQLRAAVELLFERLRHIMDRMLMLVHAIRRETAADVATRAIEEAALTGGSAAADGADDGAAAGTAGTTAEGDVAYAEFAPEIQKLLSESFAAFATELADACHGPCAADVGAAVAGDGDAVTSDIAALAPLFGQASYSLAVADAAAAERDGRGWGFLGLGALRGGKRRRKARQRAAAEAADAAKARAAVAEGRAWAPSGWYEESAVVDALVQYVVGSWRRQAARAVRRALETTFMQRFANGLGDRLGDDLQAACDADGFDLASPTSRLRARRERCTRELAEAKRLVGTFQTVRAKLAGRPVKG